MIFNEVVSYNNYINYSNQLEVLGLALLSLCENTTQPTISSGCLVRAVPTNENLQALDSNVLITYGLINGDPRNIPKSRSTVHDSINLYCFVNTRIKNNSELSKMNEAYEVAKWLRANLTAEYSSRIFTPAGKDWSLITSASELETQTILDGIRAEERVNPTYTTISQFYKFTYGKHIT